MDLIDIIHREIQADKANSAKKMIGFVDSYNPADHTVKIKYPTELDVNGNPKISGWIPVATQAGSSLGSSWVIGPNIGDQALVDHIEGDPDSGHVTGFLHNVVDTPPNTPSGSGILKHNPSGFTLQFDGSGMVVTCGSSVFTFNASGLTVLVGGNSMTLNGSGITSPMGTISNQGHDVGSTHEHTGVSAGTANTGPPQ